MLYLLGIWCCFGCIKSATCRTIYTRTRAVCRWYKWQFVNVYVFFLIQSMILTFVGRLLAIRKSYNNENEK